MSSGEKWGRAPKKDVHSSNRARLDSPAFHLVQALATLVDAAGDPAIDGYTDAVRPASAAQRKMVDVAAARSTTRRPKASARRRALGARRELAAVARGSLREADGQHRGARRRLHGARRQDRAAAPRGREARSAARCRT